MSTEFTSNTYARWMSRADGCPACVDNLQPPRAAIPTDEPNGFIASYRCGKCGHEWTCVWDDIDWRDVFAL